MLYINTKTTCYNSKNAFQILSIIQADMQHSNIIIIFKSFKPRQAQVTNVLWTLAEVCMFSTAVIKYYMMNLKKKSIMNRKFIYKK